MSVRNCLLLAVAALLVVGAGSGVAWAQPPGALEVGARAGVVLSAMNGQAIDDSPSVTSTKGGPTAALLVRWLPAPRGPWTVEAELGFSDRGGLVEPPGATSALPLHLYYLDVPVLGAYTFEVGHSIRPRVSAGLQLSALFDRSEPVADPIVIDRRVDVALVLGAGAAIPLADGELLVDLRYLGGGRDLAADSGLGTARGQAVSFTAGYAF